MKITWSDIKSAKRVVRCCVDQIKRFFPIAIAVVGASRRLACKSLKHHVGVDLVSVSLLSDL